MCNKFESRKICVAGNLCDNSDFDVHNAEHKELPEIKISSVEDPSMKEEKIVNNWNQKGLRLLWELLW